jgi:hypothetical protein
MYLGKWRNKNPRFKNIKWSTKPVKALGVFHGYAIDFEMIGLEKLNKISTYHPSLPPYPPADSISKTRIKVRVS